MMGFWLCVISINWHC